MDDSHPGCQPIDGVVLCCPQCNRHFVRQDTLDEHIRRMHNAAEQERIRREEERREDERRLQENERRAHDQAKQARDSYHQRKIINRSKPRQDIQGLIPDTIDEESGDYEFKAKRSVKPVKRSRKVKKSIKRSRKAKKSVKRSGKAKKSVKRSGKAKR